MTPRVPQPPLTPAEPVIDVMHGIEIIDPYRWLEDQSAPRTRRWIEEQTQYTSAYFEAIPYRDRIRERVSELLSSDVVSEIWNLEDRYFFLKREGNAEQPAIVMRKGLFGEDTTLVDPALRGTGTATAVAISAISDDGRFLAYCVRQSGTDHASLEILDLTSNAVLSDRLPEGFSSGIVFTPDGSGFYYAHRRLNDLRPNYRAAFWHSFGTDPAADREIFLAGEEPNLFLGILHSQEAKMLAFAVVSACFGTCVTPRFTAFATFLIEQGFLFAVPALRGGSELRDEWHSAGKREKRQNSFDDFIAAAEWLLAKGYSAPNRIAIGGGSNAGLLVGAAITQHPDLFRAAICLGPLLDMTGYHLFDLAGGWAEEYGSPQDGQDFRSLIAYLPYHRVQNSVVYPAVMLISGDADTRFNPMHARKMAARLQGANASEHPILLEYQPKWGHTPVQPLDRRIDALTDRLTFICRELSVEFSSGRCS